VKILTTRFGEIELDEARIMEMRGGVLGFEHLRRYLLLAHHEKTPFMWFQSIDDGAIAFVVINPQVVKLDYEPVIGDDDVELLEIASLEDITLMAIVTIRSNPVTVSANLRAPIVINSRKRLAKQIVLENPEYPIQYYLKTADSLDKEEGIEKNFDRGKECNVAAV